MAAHPNPYPAAVDFFWPLGAELSWVVLFLANSILEALIFSSFSESTNSLDWLAINLHLSFDPECTNLPLILATPLVVQYLQPSLGSLMLMSAISLRCFCMLCVDSDPCIHEACTRSASVNAPFILRNHVASIWHHIFQMSSSWTLFLRLSFTLPSFV